MNNPNGKVQGIRYIPRTPPFVHPGGLPSVISGAGAVETEVTTCPDPSVKIYVNNVGDGVTTANAVTFGLRVPNTGE